MDQAAGKVKEITEEAAAKIKNALGFNQVNGMPVLEPVTSKSIWELFSVGTLTRIN